MANSNRMRLKPFNVSGPRRARDRDSRHDRPRLNGPRVRKPWWVGLVVMAVAVLSYFAKQQGWHEDVSRTRAEPHERSARVDRIPGAPRADEGSSAGSRAEDGDLASLIRARRSDVLVESAGRVVKVLPDDNDGSRHQRILVRAGQDTILIAHNIDLAPRVPLKEGDEIRFKGELEWTDRGGVIHWTHNDPGRRRPGGWIECRGERYQ